MTLEQLRQQYLEDSRPNAVAVIDKAIADLPSGEMTDVINEAYALDKDLADEINGIYLDSFYG